MVSMKKTALASAVLMSVGAGAVEAAPVVNFAYSGTFTMYTPTGSVWGGDPALSGSMFIDLANGSGGAAITPSTPFSGYMWTAHAITMQMTGPGTATANMLFDWNGNLNIPVMVDFSMTPNAACNPNDMSCFDIGDSFTIATLDGNGDGVPGYPMASGPFPGWNATFGGTVTVTSVSAVPVPAAVWLFGSGLLGLVGVARRKRAA